MSNSDSFIRWYDINPKLSRASRLLFTFPDAVQSIISEAIMLIADREFKEKKWQSNIRSLGKEKILGLHKSKNRRREYDENPLLHQAMNYLFVLSEEGREFMAEHILKMVQYIQNYLELCSEAQTPPEEETLALITKEYVLRGDEGAEAFLKNLRYEFLDKLKRGENPTIKSEITEFLENVAKDSTQGMKIGRADANP